MRIHAGNLGFDSPPGFRDVTGYSFKAPSREELCEVGGGALPVGVSDLDGLVADRRSDLEDGMRDRAIVEGTTATVLAGLPAKTLTIGILDDRARVRERWTFALDTRETYLQISYSSRADNALAEGRALHVVAGASFSLPATPAPEGYTRRWTGKLWIDIPSHLAPPRTYQFVSADETTRLEVAFVTAANEPSIDQEIEQDTTLGEEVREQTSTAITTPELTGTLHSYHLTRTEDEILIDELVQRAHLRRDGAPVAHVSGRAPSVDGPALEAAIQALIESLGAVEGEGA
jgi:hypothetical protein